MTESLSPDMLRQAFHEVVASRRTIRAFLPDPVPQEVLDRCLESALMAPSASNLQPWEFIVIRDPELRQRANAVCLNQRGPATAPLMVALVAHRDICKRHCDFILQTLQERGILRKSQERYWGRIMPLIFTYGPFGLFGVIKKAISRMGSLWKPMPNLYSRADVRVLTHKSTALAAATFMLALRAEGYDSCPMEGFDPWRARKLLKLPRGAEVCMFLAIGKRAEGGLWWDRMLVPKEWVVQDPGEDMGGKP
ncbi:MAG: nitroreductase family protein [Firmicutes bacterium]|nr:nitroreductase family protein [Bacillota bacterium]